VSEISESNGEVLTIVVERKGKEFDLSVVPKLGKSQKLFFGEKNRYLSNRDRYFR